MTASRVSGDGLRGGLASRLFCCCVPLVVAVMPSLTSARHRDRTPPTCRRPSARIADPAEIIGKKQEKGDTLYYVHYIDCEWEGPLSDGGDHNTMPQQI